MSSEITEIGTIEWGNKAGSFVTNYHNKVLNRDKDEKVLKKKKKKDKKIRK